MGYFFSGNSSRSSLVVAGAYENKCGGCDTIPEVAEAFDFVKRWAGEGNTNVLFEGILVQHSLSRALELHRLHQLVVVGLSVHVDVCVESVRQRRAERGDDRPFDPKNVIREWKGYHSGLRSLRANGVTVIETDREKGPELVRRLLA